MPQAQTTIDPPSYETFLRAHENRAAAFAAYTAALTDHYDGLRASGQTSCAFCGKPQPNAVAEIQWVCNILTARSAARGGAIALLTATLTGGLTGTAHGVAKFHDEQTFTTRHATCKRCFNIWRQRLKLMRFLNQISIAIAILGLLFGLFLLMFAFGGMMKPSERADLLRWGWTAAGIGIAGVILLMLTRPRTVPASLRYLLAHRAQVKHARILALLTKAQAGVA
jgi:hypothetical protein